MNSSADTVLAGIGAALERAPRAMLVVDRDGVIVFANRLARIRFDMAPGLALAAAVTSNRDTLRHVLTQAGRMSRAVPLLLRFDEQPIPFYAWRMDPVEGIDSALVLLKEDTSKPIAARLNAAETRRSTVERRLSLSESERDRLRLIARRLETLAETDHLTGVLNGSAFTDRATRWLGQSGTGSYVYIDLDRFKPVNDRIGHDAGDHVLQVIAHRLRQATHPAGLVGRLGGDEFALWLEWGAVPGGADIAADLARVLRRPIAWRGDPREPVCTIEIGVSVGVAQAPQDGTEIAILRRIAERRMYAAKQGRDDRVDA